MIRSDVFDSLAKYPYANHMLNIIAFRARRTPDLIKGLQTGEAIISASSLGLTDSQYRYAKKQLTKFRLVTFRATNKYTCGKLLDTTAYDINEKTNDEPTTSQRRTESQSSDDKQRMKELKNERMKEIIVWFEDFWISFDDKRGRANALKSWGKIEGLDQSLADQIIQGAKNYASYRKTVLKPKNSTSKMAQGWLTDRRWEDELPKYTNGHSETCADFGAEETEEIVTKIYEDDEARRLFS